MYGELVERVGTVRSEYSNFLSNNGKLRGKKKQNELKVIVGKLEALQSDSNALLNEFRKVNEKYLPSEKFRETADKCRRLIRRFTVVTQKQRAYVMVWSLLIL